MKRIPVYLDYVSKYDNRTGAKNNCTDLKAAVSDVLTIFLPGDVAGKECLVKPNLLKAGEPLCVTSPEIILSVSMFLRNLGARVTVADSPAFGHAEKILRSMGILNMLRERGIRACSLKKSVPTRLPCGIEIGISRTAIEADLILNIPRVKAHSQMGVTCAVKNLFGTVVGFGKALAHCFYGRDRRLFSSMILEIAALLPPSVNIVDAVTIMHVTGPTGGVPFSPGLIGAAGSAVAMDTGIYHVLGVTPERVPLWQASMEKNLPGSRIKDINFLKRNPMDICIKNDIAMPEMLEPVNFNTFRFLKGRAKSFLNRIF